MNRQYWTAYFVYKVKVWLGFAQVVNTYLCRVDTGYTMHLTRLDIDEIILATEFDFITYNGAFSQLMYDIYDIRFLFQCENPYRKFTPAYRAAVAKRQSRSTTD